MRDVRTIHFHPFSRRKLRHVSENGVFRVCKLQKRVYLFAMRVRVQLCLTSGLAHGRQNPEVLGSIPGGR